MFPTLSKTLPYAKIVSMASGILERYETGTREQKARTGLTEAQTGATTAQARLVTKQADTFERHIDAVIGQIQASTRLTDEQVKQTRAAIWKTAIDALNDLARTDLERERILAEWERIRATERIAHAQIFSNEKIATQTTRLQLALAASNIKMKEIETMIQMIKDKSMNEVAATEAMNNRIKEIHSAIGVIGDAYTKINAVNPDAADRLSELFRDPANLLVTTLQDMYNVGADKINPQTGMYMDQLSSLVDEMFRGAAAPLSQVTGEDFFQAMMGGRQQALPLVRSQRAPLQHTPTPAWSPTPAPTSSPTAGPVPLPTPGPTAAPVVTPPPLRTPTSTPQPTPKPTLLPSARPAQRPTPAPTPQPTSAPSLGPVPQPVPGPTYAPTPIPTTMPTLIPTRAPGFAAYPQPTPTSALSVTPMPAPTPALAGTPMPTTAPTAMLTPAPTSTATPQPTPAFGVVPTAVPTPVPTFMATPQAVPAPTFGPSPIPVPTPTPWRTRQIPTVSPAKGGKALIPLQLPDGRVLWVTEEQLRKAR